jgi:outer membrane protein
MKKRPSVGKNERYFYNVSSNSKGGLLLFQNLINMNKNIILVWIFLLGLSSGIFAQEGKVWTLEECINHALEQNITVRKNDLTIQSLEHQAMQSKAQRMPSVNASANYNLSWNRRTQQDSAFRYVSGFDGSNSTSYSVNSSITLFNSSKLTNQIKQSELDVESGKNNLETTKESISLSILNAFLQVLYAEEQVKNSEKQIESTEGQFNLATERYNLNAISEADYMQVKSQLASEKLSLANATSQYAISKVNLMQLMELPVSNNFEIAKPSLDETLNQNRTPEVQTVYDTALAIKPQIKNAAINKEIALLDERIAKAGYYPNLSASAGLSASASFSEATSNNTYIDQIDHGLRPSAGLSLSIPIYQKSQVKTSVALAKIGYQNAELSELDTRNQLRKNIEQACQDVISAQIEYEASIEKYNSTKAASSLSDEKFYQGLINSVDYMISKTNLIVAESQLLQSKYNLIFSYKILDFYSGIPLTL